MVMMNTSANHMLTESKVGEYVLINQVSSLTLRYPVAWFW